MRIVRLAYPALFLLLGFIVGVLWSGGGGASLVPPGRARGFEESLVPIRDIDDRQMAAFLDQAKDMTIRVKEYPVNAWASHDGRFVIRLFESNETVASDLIYPDLAGGTKEAVREYSFSSGRQTFTCGFGRTIDDPRIAEVQFRLAEPGGREVVYVDSDADGRWDRFVDYSREPPTGYERHGLCWRERTNDPAKVRDSGQ